MNDHHDDSLIDKAKRLFGMGDDSHDEHAGHGEPGEHAGHGEHAAHGDHAGHAHSADEGHFENDPPLHEDPAAHPTAPDAGVSDAARRAGSMDANEDPAMRRDEYMETGAASGQIAMPGGEEPVVGDEDREHRGEGIG